MAKTISPCACISRNRGRRSSTKWQIAWQARSKCSWTGPSVLALRPRYLVLDEPTSELDPAGTLLVAAALARIARETGAGILLVEHKTDVLAQIADEVVVLERGAVALSGPAATVLADPRLVELGVEPPAGVRLERAVRASGLEWSAALAEAIE